MHEYMINYGFKEGEFEHIISSLKYSKNETILSKLKENSIYLKSIGFTVEEIIRIANSYPQFCVISKKAIEDKLENMKELLSLNDITIIKYLISHPKLLSYNIHSMKNRIEEFKSIGYSSKDTIKILLDTPNLFGFNFQNLVEKINNFYEIGFTEKQFIKASVKNTSILCISQKKLYSKFNFYESLGFDRENIIKMISEFPPFFNITDNHFLDRFTELFNMGFSKENIIKIIVSCPEIAVLSKNNIEEKFNNIKSLGFTEEEAVYLIVHCSSLFTLSFNSINTKIDKLIGLNYTKEEVLLMFKGFPQLVTLSFETLKSKLEFFELLDLREVILKNPKELMQSVKLNYARYMFYKNEENTIIDSTNYRKLFIGQAKFVELYKIDNKSLIEKYPYSGIEEFKNERTF